ncbi:MAG: efflux RND transporter periplasmic adaptor subunit [Acidobacteriota bacterium]
MPRVMQVPPDVRRLGLCAAVILSIAGCRSAPPPDTAKVAAADPFVIISPDDVATVHAADLASGVFLTGSLEPSEKVAVRAQSGGTIQQFTLNAGANVTRGQLLAVIQAEALQSQVTSGEVGVASAQSGIAAAERTLAAAQQRVEGAKMLNAAGALSRMDLLSAQSQVDGATGQVAAAKAQAAAAAAQLAQATAASHRTNVEAPISGVVSERKVSEGEAVGVGQEVLTIANLDVLQLAGQIPVQQAALVRAGQVVSFTLDAYAGQTFTAKVGRVDPVADPATRRVGVWLDLPNPGRRLISGQFVTGRVITANVMQGLLIPRTALRGEEKARYVLLIEGGKVIRRDLHVGLFDDSASEVAVLDGLKEGDRVIASPALDIQVDAKVREVTPGAAAPKKST